MPTRIHLTAEDGHTSSAYFAGSGEAMIGLVVIQEIFGVNAHIRRVCDALAGETGYAVIAPALFDRVGPAIELGYSADDVARGRELRGKLTDAAILADIKAAAAAHGKRRIGIVGYCFGGTVAWFGATRTQRFSAAVCWYGGGIAATRNEKPRCPVQMHFGEADASIPMSDVDLIRKAQPGVEIYTYPKAQHGFGCDDRASYSQADAVLAKDRTLAFFAKHLGRGSGGTFKAA
ncbi:MAG: dienelactone hydrolase family protein [Rhodospirillales bacterium]|nr:dienelactone hydrolase family protein [Rhodospirillales bacterium]